MQHTAEVRPAEDAMETATAGPRFARRFIEVNYFYVLSAALMMLGCFLLVRTGALEGTKFQRTLHSLLVLQAYEGLVILAAIVIARRFGVLGDAVTLLSVEIVLLLDPTFFSNAFSTFHRIDGFAVNVACLMLVPVKLLLLQWMLRVRLTPLMQCALLLTGLFVYLGEAPLGLEAMPITHAVYYLALSWMPLLLALVLPAMTRMIRPDLAHRDRMTSGQRVFLQWLLLGMPMFAVLSHFVESSLVHRIDLLPMFAAPAVLAVGVLFCTNGRDERPRSVIGGLDAAVFTALVLSLTPLNLGGKVEKHALTEIPDAFLASHGPLLICGIVAVGLYVWFWLMFRYRPAIIRIAALGVAGVVGLLVRVGAVGSALRGVGSTGQSFGEWFARSVEALGTWGVNHPGFCLVILTVLALSIALRWTNYGTVLVTGAGFILWVMGLLPGERFDWAPEICQVLMLWGLALSHLMDVHFERGIRGVLAIILMAVALGRFADDPVLGTAGLLGIEILLFLAAAVLLRTPSYAVASAIMGILTVAVAQDRLGFTIPSAVWVIAGGLALFGAGLWVTFHKERILRWEASWVREPAEGEEPVTAAEDSSTAD
jgi:hypothetical protein